MNKIIIVLSVFLILMAAVVFYEINQAGQQMKINGKVTVKDQVFDAEVVRSDKDMQIGLTKYSSIKETQGMLFVFDTPAIVTFWMKNMKFPIDIVFIRDDRVVSFSEQTPIADPNTAPPLYNPEAPVNYVLELKSGMVKKYHIQKGDKVKFELQ